MILIVEEEPELARVWQAHLRRFGQPADLVGTQDEAVAYLRTRQVAVVVIDLMMRDGSAFAIADFASYRQPSAKVILVTSCGFFSDGSLFLHLANVCAVMPAASRPEDIAALAEYHAGG